MFNKAYDAWLAEGKAICPRSLRGYVLKYYPYTCASCGISTHNGKPITLEVEHIDGNAKNNKKENVCLLCPNCHSQTDTYRSKNVGKANRPELTRKYIRNIDGSKV